MPTQSYSSTTDGGGRDEATSEAKQKAQEAGAQAKEQAGELAGKAKEQATTKAKEQKDQATDQLDDIRSALRETSDNLRGRDQDAIAQYVDEAAHQVGSLSKYLHTHTAGELLGEAERYARREPALFLGGSMLLGMLGARFLKSSSRSRTSRYDGSSRYARRSHDDRPEAYSYDAQQRKPGRHSSQAYSDVHTAAGAEVPKEAPSRGMAAEEMRAGRSERSEATRQRPRAAGEREGEERK